MNEANQRKLIDFYENELYFNILPFWLKNCLDEQNGGYFNCFDNSGKNLISRDKYTWSQGRFVWMWARLADSKYLNHTKQQRDEFLKLARSGRDFLYNHCLISKDDFRCVFLMDEKGAPKYVDGFDRLDMSIYADCFVIMGFARYALSVNDGESYQFAKSLYQSAIKRIETGNFATLPYPLSAGYRANGLPMSFTNVTSELYYAAEKFDPNYVPELKGNLLHFADDTLTNFVDQNNALHEIITDKNQFFQRMLGLHINPGHTLEDMWFISEAADILGRDDWLKRLAAIAKKTIEIGWDQEYGGILHFCDPNGGMPKGSVEGDENEPILKQVIEGWSDKLWWVHSEALYAMLLFYCKTGDSSFLMWHDKIADYTFKKFPNPDREIGEWVQILTREGAPMEKVVALPVKDPYHITRNLIMIIELQKSDA